MYVQLSLLERAYQVAICVVAVNIVRVRAGAVVLAVQHRLLVGHGVAPLAQQACHTNGNHQRQARQDGGIARMPLVRQQLFGNMLSDGASHYALPPLYFFSLCGDAHVCDLRARVVLGRALVVLVGAI